MAKTAYFLDSVKSRFGILFSRRGISGDAKMKDAEHEQLKVYSNRGITIVVIDKNDLKRVARGDNFLSILRTKYEKVRLDIVDDESESAEDKEPSRRSATNPRTTSKDSKSAKRSKPRGPTPARMKPSK
jgi:hypothetical protein